jgi:hypothetical protein
MPRSWAWHGSCCSGQPMEPMEAIDTQALSTVHGGFGAILGALIQQAPAIITAIGSLKGGGGGGTQTASTQPQAQPTATAPLSAPPTPPTQMASAPATSACRCCADPIGAASVQNIVRIG